MTIADEVRALLGSDDARPLIGATRRQMGPGSQQSPDPRPLYRLLGRRNLLAPHWPSELGGRGGTLADALAVVEGLIAADVPESPHTLSVMVAGTLLLASGTRSQQVAYLPRIAAGESLMSLLFTEAGAGSDAARISTTVDELGGGGYRISGQKRFCAYVDLAEHALITARSARATLTHSAMSIFIVDLGAPGVSLEAIPTISDEPLFSATFELELTAEALLGELGQGWELMNRGLVYERLGVDFAAKALSHLERAAARLSPSDLVGSADAGALVSECAAARALAHRTATDVAIGKEDFVAVAAAKWYAARTAQRVAWWSAEVGTGHPDDAGPPELADAGRVEIEYASAPGYAIAGGTAEMMLESIAAAAAPETVAERGTVGIHDPLDREFQRRLHRELALQRRNGRTQGADREIAKLVLPLDLPAAAGGFELGLPVVTLACEELGRASERRLLDAMTAADIIAAAGAASPLWPALSNLLEGEWIPAFARAGTGSLLTTSRGTTTFTGQLGVGCFAGADEVIALQSLGASVTAFAISISELPPHRTSSSSTYLDSVAATELGSVDLPVIEARRHLREAAYLTGIAAGSLACAAAHLHSRNQFGRRLADFQHLSLTLASLLAEKEAASAMTAAVATSATNHPEGDWPTDALSAHLLGATCALRSTRWTLHVHGARGLMPAADASVYYRKAIAVARGPDAPRALAAKVGERYFASNGHD